MCVCAISHCFDLSRHYVPLPVVKWKAVMAAQEARMEGGFLLSVDESSASRCCHHTVAVM